MDGEVFEEPPVRDTAASRAPLAPRRWYFRGHPWPRTATRAVGPHDGQVAPEDYEDGDAWAMYGPDRMPGETR